MAGSTRCMFGATANWRPPPNHPRRSPQKSLQRPNCASGYCCGGRGGPREAASRHSLIRGRATGLSLRQVPPARLRGRASHLRQPRSRDCPRHHGSAVLLRRQAGHGEVQRAAPCAHGGRGGAARRPDGRAGAGAASVDAAGKGAVAARDRQAASTALRAAAGLGARRRCRAMANDRRSPARRSAECQRRCRRARPARGGAAASRRGIG